MKSFLEEIKRDKKLSQKTNPNRLPDYIAAIGLISIAAIFVFGFWWFLTFDLIPSIGVSLSMVVFAWAVDATWKWKDRH